jgi:hypothetical protein
MSVLVMNLRLVACTEPTIVCVKQFTLSVEKPSSRI